MLADHQIANFGALKIIEPFDPEQVQPASYDMRLGPDIRAFHPMWGGPKETQGVIDTKRPVDATFPLTLAKTGTPLLGFCLASTVEKVHIPYNLVARVEGKSSLARLGLFVHVTAGFIDPGFEGHITLELYCANGRGIVLYPGMPICQVSFQRLEQHTRKPYEGKYQGSHDPAPVASRYYRNFKEHGGRY